MTYKVQDNFLSVEDFENLKLNLFSEFFPWYFNNYKINTNAEEIYDYQFTHIFYENNQSKSNYFSILNPLLNKLNPLALLKIKCNLTTAYKSVIQFPFHIDIKKSHHHQNIKTGVFYINTNNGKTVFENKQFVNSVANRFLEFPCNLNHAATTHTDSKIRIVLNINWI